MEKQTFAFNGDEYSIEEKVGGDQGFPSPFYGMTYVIWKNSEIYWSVVSFVISDMTAASMGPSDEESYEVVRDFIRQVAFYVIKHGVIHGEIQELEKEGGRIVPEQRTTMYQFAWKPTPAREDENYITRYLLLNPAGVEATVNDLKDQAELC
ncbi:MAG: hypothetical protein M1548_03025 [Actinobacteria bacterium]|nr:hypothetical protein [Actinomycetota bacterium]